MKTFAPPVRSRPAPRESPGPALAPWRAAPLVRGGGAERLQAKLAIGAPHDRFEQEADRVADTVLRMPDPGHDPSVHGSPAPADRIQRICPECEEALHRQPEEEEETMQTRAAPGATPTLTTATESAVRTLEGRGEPLPAGARSFLEPRFGADFSAVRVHRDARSAELAHAVGARAFAVGRNVVFGPGEYAPESRAGRHLLAHELTHVVQQGHAPSAREGTAHRRTRAPTLQRLPFGISLPSGMRFLDSTERGIADPVYGTSLNYGAILLSDGLGGGGRPFTLYMSLPLIGGVTVINIGSSAYNSPGSNAPLLLHELAHSWQSQHHPNPAQYMINSVESQAAASLAGGSAYCYVPGKWFGLYGAEQIAEQVEDGVSAIRSHIKSTAAGVPDPANIASLAAPHWEKSGDPGVHC